MKYYKQDSEEIFRFQGAIWSFPEKKENRFGYH